jgi:hypothetical protein
LVKYCWIAKKCSVTFLSEFLNPQSMNNLIVKSVLALLLSFNFYLLSSQVPQGFNYQAIARDNAQNPIAEEKLKIRIGILTSVLPEPVVVYEAEYTVTTNTFGLFQLVVGDPEASPVTGLFSDVDWSVKPLYLRTKILWNEVWEEMGSAQLFSVPYSLMSGDINGPLKKLSVAGETANMEEALFEVKNNKDQTVFAVYNEGVRISVGDATAKGSTKGGFAIGGFDVAKTPGQIYLRVTQDSTRVYVKNLPAKGSTKGGFAIGGFDVAGKGGPAGTTGNFMDLTPKNYFIGNGSGALIGTGTNNGAYNSVIGYLAGQNLTTGSYNTMLGYLTGLNVSSGINNILIGDNAGYHLTSGWHNTLIGSSAGFNHTVERYNVMIGTSAGYNINAGWDAGSYNTFVGINSGFKIRGSKENTFLGTNAGYMLESGWSNTIVGIDAGRGGADDPNNYHGYVTERNTMIGCQAGRNLLVGNNNVFIGYQAGYSASGDNKLYIANSNSNPPLIYGDFSSARIGLGTTAPGYKLDVVGDINVSSGNFKINGTNLSASSVGAEPALTKGNLTATGPISVSPTQQVIGGAAVISISGATTSAAGAVQLSNSFSGSGVTLATTEKALSDGLATKATGSGMTLGIISPVSAGTFLTACGGKYVFSISSGSITITNTSGSYAALWWQGQLLSGAFGGRVVINAPNPSTWIIPTTFTPEGSGGNGEGIEMHLGSTGGGSYCSVWLSWSNSGIFGHYMMN